MKMFRSQPRIPSTGQAGDWPVMGELFPRKVRRMADPVRINRAPVPALWAAVVCERLGHDEDAALTLGKAVAGLNAQSKGRSLGVLGHPAAPGRRGQAEEDGLGQELWIEVLGRPVHAKNTDAGVRAVVKDEALDPEKVGAFLQSKFGEDFDRGRDAMRAPAEAGYQLYERFRPQIALGKSGWGQKGELDLGLIRSVAKDG